MFVMSTSNFQVYAIFRLAFIFFKEKRSMYYDHPGVHVVIVVVVLVCMQKSSLLYRNLNLITEHDILPDAHAPCSFQCLISSSVLN